jgi:hypothetical protein
VEKISWIWWLTPVIMAIQEVKQGGRDRENDGSRPA